MPPVGCRERLGESNSATSYILHWSSTGGENVMNTSAKTLIGAFLVLAAGAASSHAQVRDAGSKLLGNYERFDRSERRAPIYRTPQATIARQSAEQPARIAQQRVNRSFSYDTRTQTAPCDTLQAAPAPQAVKPPAPTQSVRRYSYEPGVSAPRRSFVPSRGWQSGVRDAGSKIRGEY